MHFLVVNFLLSHCCTFCFPPLLLAFELSAFVELSSHARSACELSAFALLHCLFSTVRFLNVLRLNFVCLNFLFLKLMFVLNVSERVVGQCDVFNCVC